MLNIAVGDWVQATEPVSEQDFRGPGLWEHARKGALGHVLHLDGEWITVFWERSGTIADAHVDDLRRLCGPDAGR